MLRPSGLNNANVCLRDIKPCSMSRNFNPSKGNMNFFSLSSSSLYHEILSDVNTNQYGREPPVSKARDKKKPVSFCLQQQISRETSKYSDFTFHNAQILDCKIPFADDLIAQLSGAGFIWIAIRFALGTVEDFKNCTQKLE